MGWFSSKKKTVPQQPRAEAATSSSPPPPPPASLPPCTQQWSANYTHNNRSLVPQESYPVPIPCRPPPPPYQDHNPCPPIIVNQHYYLGSPPHAAYPPSHGGSPAGKLRIVGSVANLADDFVSSSGALVQHVIDDGLPRWHGQATQLLNQGAAVCDQIAGRLDSVLTLIDREMFHGHERDLFTYQPAPLSPPTEPAPARPAAAERPAALRRNGKKDASKGQSVPTACSVLSGDYFAKVELYANSRLPMNLPALKLYIPTYPLMCLAAQYAEKVYEKPQGAERDAHVEAEWRTGTKAMRIKSVSMDHMNTIVFAIRGSATFMDWAVNLNAAPTAPNGFLDDPGNFCHAGFLSAARKMIKPVAARLRQLLDENPHRSSYSLLITGHSAGGAVAALLYSHMLATSKAASSELNVLTGCFKRVHCITFGTPPVSLLPLSKPDRRDLKKSLFLTFINEGDPVARADKAYVKSLLELFAAPAPGSSPSARDTGGGRKSSSSRSGSPSKRGRSKDKKSSKTSQSLANKASKLTIKSMATSAPPKTSSRSSRSSAPARPVWPVPPSALSAAGLLIVLRTGDPKARIKSKKTVEERLNEGVVAQVVTDEQLRDVIWGDPVCHLMKLYAGRIETLAVGAVTAKGGR